MAASFVGGKSFSEPPKAPTKVKASDKPKEVKEEPKSERKINDDGMPEDAREAMAIGNFVQVLFGQF